MSIGMVVRGLASLSAGRARAGRTSPERGAGVWGSAPRTWAPAPAGVPWAGARGRGVGLVGRLRRSGEAQPYRAARGGRGWAPMILPPRLMAGGSPRVLSGAARRCGLLRSTDRRGRPGGAAAASPPRAPGRRRAAASRPGGLSCAGVTGLGGGSSRQETGVEFLRARRGPGSAPSSMARRRWRQFVQDDQVACLMRARVLAEGPAVDARSRGEGRGSCRDGRTPAG